MVILLREALSEQSYSVVGTYPFSGNNGEGTGKMDSPHKVF